MPIDDSATQRALDRLLVLILPASARVSEEMGAEVRRAARANLEDPLGHLADSITLTGPDRVGTSAYRTQVGPTAIYGRQRELGGPIDPHDSGGVLTAHYRAPGYWMWDFGHGLVDVFTGHVDQVGQHYLKRGVEESLPELLRIAKRIWGAVLRTAL